MWSCQYPAQAYWVVKEPTYLPVYSTFLDTSNGTPFVTSQCVCQVHVGVPKPKGNHSRFTPPPHCQCTVQDGFTHWGLIVFYSFGKLHGSAFQTQGDCLFFLNRAIVERRFLTSVSVSQSYSLVKCLWNQSVNDCICPCLEFVECSR